LGLRAGLRRLTIRDELPHVEAGIARSRPVLLGIDTTAGLSPRRPHATAEATAVGGGGYVGGDVANAVGDAATGRR
jgi:hypothetical protein